MYYKVNYQYVGPSSQLRTGTVVLEAKDANTAKQLASKALLEKGTKHKIGNAQVWGE